MRSLFLGASQSGCAFAAISAKRCGSAPPRLPGFDCRQRLGFSQKRDMCAVGGFGCCGNAALLAG
jgi:hypothetical protein